MTWFAHRRADGSVASLHQEIQPGYAEEPLADNHPDVLPFFALRAKPKSEIEKLIDALTDEGIVPSGKRQRLKDAVKS